MNDDLSGENLLFMIKKICLNLSAQMEQRLKNKDITGVQVYFLVYILRHHPQGTCLTELCREIGVSKATISTLLKKMREKEYLYFYEDPDDVRKKRILPTARLIAEGEELRQKTDRLEEEICSILNGKEKKDLWKLENKLIGQFAVMGENKKERQEVYKL